MNCASYECLLFITIIEKRIQMEPQSDDQTHWFQQIPKQAQFIIGDIKISSKFQSGNITKAIRKQNNHYQIWTSPDPKSNYKSWFYFSIQGVLKGTVVTFTVMNMSNQVKLLRQGHLPVYKTQKDKRWRKITSHIPSSSVVKCQEGYQVTFKQQIIDDSAHFFAFSFPWTVKDQDQLTDQLKEQHSKDIFIEQIQLGRSYKGRPLNMLIITKDKDTKGKMVHAKMQQIFGVKQDIITFPNKKGIFVSARVHPGEVAASHMMNGFLTKIVDQSQQSSALLQHCVFYIIPIINPDGVAEGNFRNDSQGQNLNRYYDNPSLQKQPEIFVIKKFIGQMIKRKRIQFCLDLHAHVNKQNCFIYGNSVPDLKKQLEICLFAKMLSYNCQFFDYEACNFSQKNMGSKDKGDDLSKEGASRVAIYKQTGLATCWTLECNYHSAKTVSILPKPICQDFSKSVTDTVIRDCHGPQIKNSQYVFEIEDFNKIGGNIAQTIADYYHLRNNARIFNTKLKNYHNFRLSHAISVLRIIPFKFDTQSRKLLSAINNGDKNVQVMKKLENVIGIGNERMLHQKAKTNFVNSKYASQKHVNCQKMKNEYGAQGQKRGKSKVGVSSTSVKSIDRKVQVSEKFINTDNNKQKVSIKMNTNPLPLPRKKTGL